MTGLALADILPDFGTPRRDSERAPEVAHILPPKVQAVAQGAQAHIEERIEREVARAEQAVTERLNASFEERLRQERAGHAAEIERLQMELGSQTAERLAAGLEALENGLTALVTSTTARVLSGIVTDDVRKRSIDALTDAVRHALSRSGSVRIDVHGPASLFGQLSAGLGEQARLLHHVDTPGFDLVVNIDGELIETRLAEWSAALSEALS